MSSSRRFIAALAGGAVATLALTVAATFLTDPRGIVAAAFPGAPRLCDAGSDLPSREVKPYLAVVHPPREILVGNSRVAAGFRGTDAQALLRSPAVNLGFDAARLEQVGRMVREAWQVAPVERVWLGADYLMFVQPPVSVPASPAPIERRRFALRYGVADRTAMQRTLAYLAGAGRCRRRQVDPHGFGTDDTVESPGRRLTRLRRAQPHADRLLARLAADPAARGRSVSAAFQELDALAAEARQRGIDLVLFVGPSHPRFHQRIRETGLEADYREWRRRLFAFAAARGLILVDLTGDPAIAAAAAQPGCPLLASPGCPFHDFTHYRHSIGRRILELGIAASHRDRSPVSRRE